MIWLVALIGVAVPAFATFLLSFVSPPAWLSRGWIRVGMAVAVVVIPGVVGWLSARMVADEERPRGGKAPASAVLRSYPYTLGLALTLVVMTVLAPVMKLRTMARRWTTEHVPVIVEPQRYQDVVGDLERAPGEGGVRTRRTRASVLLRLPTRLLALFARRPFANLMARQLTTLVADNGEVLVHPSDIVISAAERDAAHMRAVLSEHLTYTSAYLTWDKEANDTEDRLREGWQALRAGRTPAARAALEDVGGRLHSLNLPYEEWGVLFRETLVLERALRQHGARRGPDRTLDVVTALVTAAPVVETVASTVARLRRALLRRAA